MSFIKDIYKTANESQTVFSLTELSTINPNYIGTKLNSAIKYLVKNGDLTRLSRGLYSLNKDYSRQEFANKYRSPSYISLYTALSESGIVFQPYSSIYLLSKRSETKIVNEINIIYKNIKDEILLNSLGIFSDNNISKASPERAICDTIYLLGDQFFDNTRQINWEFLRKINQEVFDNNKVISKWIQENIKPN